MSKSVLLADDSPTIRKVVEITFADSDYHLETAASGAEALTKLEVLRPDVVLADVVMPEPTGYELCRRIKASERPVPVLLLAGTFESFDHEEARTCGADGCLLKPFEPRMLLERVTSLLSDRDAVADSAVEPVAAAEVAEAPPETIAAPADSEEQPPALAAADPAAAGEPAADAAISIGGLAPEAIDAIAREVVRRLSDDVVRRIAQEVVPEIAEAVVRERIRDLENEDR